MAINSLIEIDYAVNNQTQLIACSVNRASCSLVGMALLDRLQAVLDKLGISQRELARRAGFKNQTDIGVLFHRLRENPSASVDSETLAAIAKVGGVTTDWLLGIDEQEGNVASSIEAARAWLDAAAALRREGSPVTTESLLLRLTLGKRGQEHDKALNEAIESVRLQIEADIQSLGVPATKAHELGRTLADRFTKLRTRDE